MCLVALGFMAPSVQLLADGYELGLPPGLAGLRIIQGVGYGLGVVALVAAIVGFVSIVQDPTEHYLPLERAVDLDIYANKNITKADLTALRRDLGAFASAKGMRATHTAVNLLAEMRELGIKTSVLLPIDVPLVSWNAEVYIDCAHRYDGLVSMGSVHPFRRRLRERLEAQKARGAPAQIATPAANKRPARGGGGYR